jgi:hypothetical protein
MRFKPKMSDPKQLITIIREKVFLAAITGYAGAGLEPSMVTANAKDISDQVSVDDKGNIILIPCIDDID